ncbi:MAG: NAD(P)H-hydrate dehydratase [bacterium]
MKAVTTAQMRELDKIATTEFAIPGFELMRRAGEGVAGTVSYLSERIRGGDAFIHLVAGRGNNGGDAFAAALLLHEDDFDVEVLLAGSASDIRGDALRHLGKMRAAGIPLIELPTKEAWMDALQTANSGEIIVDGVLGIGASGPPRGPIAGAIHYINSISEDNLVVSIDIPSGLNADTGEVPGECVIADVTATIGMPKIGMLTQQAIPYIGTLDVIGIGIPMELTSTYESARHLITGWDVRQRMPKRSRLAHKGDFGHALIIGGAIGYAGAPAMAAIAAQRSGAGLVSALVPRPIYPVVAGTMLEVMTHPGDETNTGSLNASNWESWLERINTFSAIVAGPGMSRHPDTTFWIHQLLKEGRRPLLLDADALNALEGYPERIARAQCPVVITPHPGELARLLGCTTKDVQANREAAVKDAAERTNAVVVLKGAGTLVAQKGQPLHMNMTGNPGMATGGTGDILSGFIGGLMAQGLSPFDAACVGVFLHGRAGDNAMWVRSQASLTATDLLKEFGNVFREVTIR